MRRRSILTIGAILAIFAAAYCFAGYAMSASFSAAHESEAYARSAAGWGIAGLVSLAAAGLLALLAWRWTPRER
jgi:hypothetical protein